MSIAQRHDIISLLVSEGFTATGINEALAKSGYETLSEKEAQDLGLAMTYTAAHILNSPASAAPKEHAVAAKATTPDAGINVGQVLTKNPVDGSDFTELNNAVTQVVGMISAVLRQADPASWNKYKAMKIADPSPAGKRAAYEWAFKRLLAIGYVPTGE